jgi:PAS domain S-box-containing protein
MLLQRSAEMKRENQDFARTLSVTEADFVISDEQRYRGIFEHAVEGIFQTTPDGRYIGANPALARIYGYDSPDDLRAQLWDISRQLYVQPGRRAEFLQQVARQGKVTDFESQVYRKDGSVIWISENAVAVRDDLGRLLYFEGFVVDITARHAADAALKQARDELERSLAELRATQQQVVQTERLRALGAMVTGIAHDFNNALTLILGYGELLQYRCRHHPAGEEFAEYAQTIVTASLDAAEIVARLRDFHRPAEPGEAHAPLALNAIIERAVAFTRPRWEAESRGQGTPIEVFMELTATSPIAGNSSELRAMLTNLIFNAVDAMPQGGTITIRTRESKGRLELAIADTGIGMTEEVRRRCLEPFFTTKGDGGSGLGLSVVYGIVERHSGTVSIESQSGWGSLFVFTFPIDTSGALAQPAEPAPVTRPLRILVVDDQPVQCELIAHALQRDWHTVAVASHGREALKLFESREFDLVITDKAMPEMNGNQLAVAVKSREPDTRVIMLTGFGSGSDDTENQSEFVDLVLSKPASLAELRAAIAEVIG